MIGIANVVIPAEGLSQVALHGEVKCLVARLIGATRERDVVVVQRSGAADGRSAEGGDEADREHRCQGCQCWAPSPLRSSWHQRLPPSTTNSPRPAEPGGTAGQPGASLLALRSGQRRRPARPRRPLSARIYYRLPVTVQRRQACRASYGSAAARLLGRQAALRQRRHRRSPLPRVAVLQCADGSR